MRSTNGNGKFYSELEMYVERIANDFLKPHRDFKEVKYRRLGTTSEAYLRLVDTLGDSHYFDVTAENEEGVCTLLCNVVALVPVPELVTDKDIKRKIAPLFG